MNSKQTMPSGEFNGATSRTPADKQSESRHATTTPEEELPSDAATNPGSPDPTVRGQMTDREALEADQSLGAPEPNFFDNEDAGSDGEPGAGRFGGTDVQYLDELAAPDPQVHEVEDI